MVIWQFLWHGIFWVNLGMDHLSLYEELLNLPSVKITAIKIEPHLIIIDCQVRQVAQACPNCGQITDAINQYYPRTLRDLNMGSRQVQLALNMRQFYCQNCHRYFSETTLPC